MKKLLYLISICLTLTTACSNDDDFSTDNNLRLNFSTDKISFDTVFTNIGSAIKQFKIYNRNDKSLLIESIELMHASESGFRMNIDGEKGIKLSNIEILKKDSLFGFIEVTVNPLNINSPVLIEDSIRFTYNGNIQHLRLQAIGQDVYIWQGETVTQDTLIAGSKPLLVYDSLVVKENATLSVGEGMKFFMKENAAIHIHGTIAAQGSVRSPIVFRGERFDNIEGDIPYDNVPGQWNGIYFFTESTDNILSHVIVKNAVRGMSFQASGTTSHKASLENMIVQNNSVYGITAEDCKIDASNCLFVNSGGAALKINGGEYSILHCTIANYFRWSSRREEALVIGNNSHLVKCDFINSIIYGSVTNELALNNYSSNIFNYQFINCLIKTKETPDNNFINTIRNEDPMFRNVKSNGTFSYDFRLERQSPAINKGDKTYSVSVPFDLNGNSRLDDANPDLGCYEFTE